MTCNEYDNNILKALQSIATSLHNIDRKLNAPTGINAERVALGLPHIEHNTIKLTNDLKEHLKELGYNVRFGDEEEKRAMRND